MRLLVALLAHTAATVLGIYCGWLVYANAAWTRGAPWWDALGEATALGLPLMALFHVAASAVWLFRQEDQR